MIIDVRSLQQNTEIRADICIVGAGVAGITLARELANQGFSVALLESGGLTFEEDTQALYNGDCSTDAPYIHQLLEETRRRQFGGTAQRWNVALGHQGGGVRYLPLAEVDFEKRPHVSLSGWPFTRQELDPFYARAQKVCGLGDYTYDTANWATREQGALPFRSSHVETSMFQFGSRLVFTRVFQEQVRVSKQITLYLHANLVGLDTSEGGTVECAHVKTLEGKQIAVRAVQFVIAAGGIENARLLLATEEGRRYALGNEHDLVGRYFMDHPLVRGGEFHPTSPDIVARMALYDIRNVKGAWVMAHLTLSKEVLRQTMALNTSMLLYPRHANYHQRHIPNPRERRAVDSARYLSKTIKNRRVPQNPFEHLLQIGTGLNGVFSALQQRYISDEST
ncbi:MAG TPA: FAD-dependent oxidoreductase, partial [Roseiflexaceae bacterium]|nr:FAD-dependent oxidoreductase [Roseiflexaceae bacterium]